MYVMDVEDHDDEETEEQRKEEATGPKLQCTSKPLITQRTSFETNSIIRHSKTRFKDSMLKDTHTKDGLSSTVADGRLPSTVTTDASGSKNVGLSHSNLSFKHKFKTASNSEGICNDIRETTEERESLDNAGNKGNYGKPVGSFQSNSWDQSSWKSSSVESLIAEKEKLSTHIKEKDADDDPISRKTLSSRKSQTPDPHEDSPPQHNEKMRVDSACQASRRSILASDDRHLLASATRFDKNSSTERREQTQESLGQPEISPKSNTVRFEDWTCDAEQVEFSRTSRSLDEKEFIAGPCGEYLQPRSLSNKTNAISRNSYVLDVASSKHFHLNDMPKSEKLTAMDCISKHQFNQSSSSRRIIAHHSTAREKHHLETESRGSFNPHSTSRTSCDCDERYMEERPSGRAGSKIRHLVDTCGCNCQSGGSSKGLQLHVSHSEAHDSDYVKSSRKKSCNCRCNSTAERNFLMNAISRRKRCKCDCEKRNNYNVQDVLSEHCSHLGLIDCKTRSPVQVGKKCCHSVNRSCREKDLPCPCSAGPSHPQSPHDCPDRSRSTKRQACKDLLLQVLKAPGVKVKQLGRQIPTSKCGQTKCHNFEPLPETPDGSTTIIRSLLFDEHDNPKLQMIGEIAGQLESRIVGYVFAGLDRKSSYGILVRNIPEVIETFCQDRQTGRVIVPLQFRLVKRFAYVKTSIRPFGYNCDFHPQFSIDMVNKYGRLNLSGAQAKFRLSPIDLDVRQDLSAFIQASCPPSEVEHVSILLDCLLLLASDDGKSLFIWEQKI